jgi:hypothetical protein
MLRARSLTIALTTLLVAASLPVNAQSRRNGGRSDGCNNSGWDDRRASFCEVREETIGGSAPLDVDAGANGGIKVFGWDRGDVLVRSIVRGSGDTDCRRPPRRGRRHIETCRAHPRDGTRAG